MGSFPGGNVVRVTPTLSTDAYASGDVLFVATKIPNAVKNRGGVSKLKAMFVLDKDDTSDASNDIFFVFQEKEGTAPGTINSSANISDSDFQANKPLGFIQLDAERNVNGAGIQNSRLFYVNPGAGDGESSVPNLLLKADEGSTDVYVWAYLSGGTPTYSADGLELIFHIEYID